MMRSAQSCWSAIDRNWLLTAQEHLPKNRGMAGGTRSEQCQSCTEGSD